MAGGTVIDAFFAGRSRVCFLAWFLALLTGPALLAGPALGQDAVKRGEYVFLASSCAGCHTDEKNKGKPLAGGRPLDTPFGIYYSPNITPDPKTGIGRWSEADFRRAMREGVGPGGYHLFPVFPYTSFTHLTDGDIADLFAYLKSREPVAQANKPHDVSPPFGWRFTLWFWKLLFFDEGPLKPVAGKSPEWNRGRYLVEAAGHCGECHTPRNFLGAVKTSEAYAGVRGGPDGQNAPNITPDPETGIGKWSEDDIVNLLKDGMTPDFDYVGSGMGEVVRNTGKLTDEDRKAMAVYLKSLTPIKGPPKRKSGS